MISNASKKRQATKDEIIYIRKTDTVACIIDTRDPLFRGTLELVPRPARPAASPLVSQKVFLENNLYFTTHVPYFLNIDPDHLTYS